MSESTGNHRSPRGYSLVSGHQALRRRRRSPAHPTLQPPHRRGLPPLDSPLPRVSQQHSSARTGRVRRQPFLDAFSLGQNVAASTQNQALAAVLFLYEHVVEQPLDRIEGVARARKPKRLPVVLTRDEVVCHPSVGGRLRYKDRAGASGAQGRPDHDGLHARIESWRSRGPQPARPSAESSLCRGRPYYRYLPVGVKLGVKFIGHARSRYELGRVNTN